MTGRPQKAKTFPLDPGLRVDASGKIERAECFVTIAAAEVNGMDRADPSLGWEVAVPAKYPRDVRILTEQIADPGRAEIGAGEIPLRAVHRRQ